MQVAPMLRVRRLLPAVLLAAGIAHPGPAQDPGVSAKPADRAFALGERMVYHVEWSPPWYLFFLPSMHAGEASLGISEGPEVDGKKATRVLFTAQSSGTLAKLTGVDVDDYYESFVNGETLCTFKVIKKIREGKRKRDSEVEYRSSTGQMHIREVNVATSPPKVDRDQVIDDIPACVKDIFTALYDARTKDFDLGVSHRLLIADDDKIREVEVRVLKETVVKTVLGKLNTWEVDTVSLLGGLFKDGGQFRMWLTADERKLPVKFEVKVRLGKVTGQLNGYFPSSSNAEGRSQP